MSRSYYITPFRLTKNPFLWRSIGLMTSIKTDQKIVMPEATYRWLRSGTPPNWATLSEENAMLCLKYGSYLEYRWSECIPLAQKLLDKMLVDKDPNQRLSKIAMSCTFLKEETLTLFIENQFKEAAASVAVEPPPSTPWYSSPAHNNVINWSSWIASNPGLKTYQFEMMYKSLPPKVDPLKQFIGKVKLNTVPDYILKDLLDRSLGDKANLSEYHHYPLLREALVRKLLVRVDPFTEVVLSQPRPLSFDKPVATTPVVVQA